MASLALLDAKGQPIDPIARHFRNMARRPQLPNAGAGATASHTMRREDPVAPPTERAPFKKPWWIHPLPLDLQRVLLRVLAHFMVCASLDPHSPVVTASGAVCAWNNWFGNAMYSWVKCHLCSERLELVVGSLGVGVSDPYFILGGEDHAVAEDFIWRNQDHSIARFDYYAWLETPEGNVVDVLHPLLCHEAALRNRLLPGVRGDDYTAVTGAPKDELVRHGLHYRRISSLEGVRLLKLWAEQYLFANTHPKPAPRVAKP
jgi:hypothetical protein